MKKPMKVVPKSATGAVALGTAAPADPEVVAAARRAWDGAQSPSNSVAKVSVRSMLSSRSSPRGEQSISSQVPSGLRR